MGQKKTDTKATTRQTAVAKSSGPKMPSLFPAMSGLVGVIGAIIFAMKMMGGSKKKKSGPLISFSKPAAPPATIIQAAPAVPTGRYPVGQVVTLPNGQRA